MAEIILAVICIVVGIVALAAAALVLGANAIGGVTNASAVNITPALLALIVALLAFAGAASILFF